MAIDLEGQTADLDRFELVYVLFCAFGVSLITPGIGFYYAGALKRKNVVQVIFQSYMCTAVITALWFLMGYSLAANSTDSVMIGDFGVAALHEEQAKSLYEGGTIPSVANFTFNTFFPVATVQIFIGALGERGRFLPSMVLGVFFTLIVYCPQAYWVWAPNGWLYTLGALDFAGGGPVHISAAWAALVYSVYLGPRGQPGKKFGKKVEFRGYDVAMSGVGVTLIVVAWTCFNSGTLLAVNVRTGYIFANTMIAAAFACVSYVTVDKLLTGKYSAMAAFEGMIVGLVNITPSCGYYWPWAAAVTSIITAVLTRFAITYSERYIDDSSRAWPIHGIAGIIGDTLTGIFASSSVAGLDGITVIPGGWVSGNFRQLGLQIAGWLSISLWTITLTYISCFVIDHIPGLKLRASPEGEEMGMDLYEMAETLDEFGNDYDEFFMTYAAKLREIADNLEKRSSSNAGGVVEVIDGESPDDSHSSVNVPYHQKV